MKTNLFMYVLVGLIILSFIFSGCSMYAPATPSPTLFTQRKQSQIGVNLGFEGAGVQAAYTPVKHLLIFCNAYNMYSDSSIEGGIGGYINLENPRLFLESIGGLGSSCVSFRDTFSGSGERDVEGSYKKKFIQFSCAYRTKGFNGVGLGLRLVNISFKYNHTYRGYMDGRIIGYSSLEPFVFSRFNLGDNTSLSITAGATTGWGEYGLLTVAPFYFRLSFNFYLGKI